MDGGDPAGIRMVPSFGCRKNRMRIRIITSSGKKMTTLRGTEMVFSRILLLKKGNRGRNLVARRCASSRVGMVDFCIRAERRSTKPMVAADRRKR